MDIFDTDKSRAFIPRYQAYLEEDLYPIEGKLLQMDLAEVEEELNPCAKKPNNGDYGIHIWINGMADLILLWLNLPKSVNSWAKAPLGITAAIVRPRILAT